MTGFIVLQHYPSRLVKEISNKADKHITPVAYFYTHKPRVSTESWFWYAFNSLRETLTFVHSCHHQALMINTNCLIYTLMVAFCMFRRRDQWSSHVSISKAEKLTLCVLMPYCRLILRGFWVYLFTLTIWALHNKKLVFQCTVDVYYCPTMNCRKEMEALTAAINWIKLRVVVRRLQKDLGKQKIRFKSS